jgi:hypothetical protein
LFSTAIRSYLSTVCRYSTSSKKNLLQAAGDMTIENPPIKPESGAIKRI